MTRVRAPPSSMSTLMAPASKETYFQLVPEAPSRMVYLIKAIVGISQTKRLRSLVVGAFMPLVIVMRSQETVVTSTRSGRTAGNIWVRSFTFLNYLTLILFQATTIFLKCITRALEMYQDPLARRTATTFVRRGVHLQILRHEGTYARVYYSSNPNKCVLRSE